ncbi:MAG: cytochrome C [Planctomycetes bacterium]|nr:cytochrome C [Planctomycetota bacterium]
MIPIAVDSVRCRSLLRIFGTSALFSGVLLIWACGSASVDSDDSARLAKATPQDVDPHQALFLEDRFPSAQTCRTCHPDHYRMWSASPHSYAQLSPVFNAMHGTILKKMNGTTGDFCIRCHTPIGMTIEEPLFTSNLDRHATSIEGITCIVCHRVNENYGKVSGRRSLVEGDLLEPVFGPTGPGELERIIADGDFRVETTRDGQGRKIHADVNQFFALTTPGFCGACHDVNLPNGFRLEEAFSEYKTSPAAARGESCQDCHMGIEPGIASGFRHGPAAIVGGTPTRSRQISDHSFVGPDHSIVHPGIFPHNPDAANFATMAEWLTFDVAAGWGTDAFEDDVEEDSGFPERWSSADDRYDAREILEQQFELLAEVDVKRTALLKRGYVLAPIQIEASSPARLAFSTAIANGTDGHNVPTGFTAERLVWLDVRVRDARGQEVFASGDLDPNGDVRDLHSLYVHAGELPQDEQLLSLQSKFITETIRGGEREQILAVNHSLDALPFLRPETSASTLRGQPRGARIHKYGIEPGGRRRGDYEVEGLAPGRYEIEVQLKAAMVPVNLVSAIQHVGFDYGLSPREVADRIVAGHLVLWTERASVDVH